MAPAIPQSSTDALKELTAVDPSYKDQNDASAKASIDELSAKAKDNQDIGNATSESVSDPSTKDEILKLITELAKEQAKIESLFQDVADKLSTVDDLKVSSELRPDWIGLRDKYRTLVRQSKTQASQLSSFAQSFGNVLVPSIVKLKDDAAGIKALLDVYIEEVAQRQKESQAISDRFTALEDDLTDFNNRFSNFAKTKSAELEKEQTDLNNRLIELQLSIKKYDAMILAFGLTAGISVFAGAVGGVFLLSPLAPIGIFIIGLSVLLGLGSLAGLIYAMVEKNKTQSEIDDVNKQLKDIAAQQAAIAAASATLKTIPPQIASIVGTLKGFNNIWDWIVGELVKIKTDAERADKLAAIWEALNLQLNSIQKSWNGLSEVLDAYVANIIDTNN